MLAQEPRIPPLLDKTLYLLRKHKVIKVAEGCYLVKSQTDPLFEEYLVRKNEQGSFTCTCKGFQRRGRCSHTLACFLKEESEKNPQTKLRNDSSPEKAD